MILFKNFNSIGRIEEQSVWFMVFLVHLHKGLIWEGIQEGVELNSKSFHHTHRE